LELFAAAVDTEKNDTQAAAPLQQAAAVPRATRNGLATMSQQCTLSATGETMEVPAWTRIKQSFDDTALPDVPAAVTAAMEASGIELKPGATVAITVGSRGVANIGPLTRAVADWCKAQGASPYVVPSMGTHGGATAEGQQEMIEGLGCTEELLGCPIRSTMEVKELPRGDLPCPVLHDQAASEADACIVINRIKPHTQVGTAAFLKEQPYQSGLFKMMVIGLGNNAQATELHAGNYPRRMCELMPAVARQKVKLSTDGSGLCNIVGGLAIVENAYDQVETPPFPFLHHFPFLKHGTFAKTGSGQTRWKLHSDQAVRVAQTMLLEGMTASTIESREPEVRKRHFLRHLYIKCIILPRQARDKHRKNSNKVPFSRSCSRWRASTCQSSA
jgi:hypothetical protein